ncbi:protein tyrosine phosphatase [Acinetobacter cumulans]|uniref:Protein tyrosine phosphatase n=1 Tax=Acinetobacter cumulans TaxID=2136182 RepID=A0ABX9U2Z1_9GAMM|nr:dual specificity protein phosphatase family protein [Acinetobacter cumulans]RLL40145.1 protein tyrosine phosphatase [Acinetobacter cumulans]
MKKYSRTILMLTLSMSVTGCMSSPSWTEQQRPKQWATVIDRKINLYQVSPWLYRSEQPSNALMPTLQHNQIHTIINLRARDADTQPFAQKNLALVHIPIHTWSISRNDLLQVMKQLQAAQAQHQNVLIHCYHGSDRTGASIAMYRIIFEGWSEADALAEMKHGGFGFHPIWINIEALFRPENIKWIREQLANPS